MRKSWPERWLRNDGEGAQDVRIDLLWLLGLGVLLIATGIGLRDPWPADEPRFALIARDMLASGHWFLPHVAGDLYADKPPLYFWLLALSLKLTGSARAAFLLPSLLASLGSVVLVYDLARRLWDRRSALIAGTLLLLSLQFVWQARQAQIDAVLCFWTTLSLYGLLRHLLLGPQWRWYAIGWAAAGFGVITKGVGFLPLLVFIPWIVLRRRWALAPFEGGVARWLIGPAAFAGAVATWLAPMLVLASSDSAIAAYRDEILFKQTVERYADAWHHVEPFWYFIVQVIPFLWLPLTALLPWLIPKWRHALRARDMRIALLLSWTVLVIAFFSFSAGKRGVYVLPAVPAFVLVAAPFMLEIGRMRAVQRTVFGIAVGIGAICAAGTLFLFIEPAKRVDVLQRYGLDPVGPLLLMAVLIAVVCTLAQRRQAFGAFAGVLASVLLVVSFWLNPVLDPVQSGAVFVDEVQRSADPQKRLGLIAFKEQYMLHIQRPVTHFGHARWLEREKEAADGAAWLNAREDRQLVVTGYAKSLCFPTAPALALGEANRLEWFLISGRTESPCAKNGNHTAAYEYVPPTLGYSNSETSTLLSRDRAHHLRTDPRAVRSKRVAEHGE